MKITLKKSFISFILLGGLFLFPSFSQAAVLLQQPYVNVQSNLQNSVAFRFLVGQNVVGFVTSVTVSASTTYTGIGTWDATRVDLYGYSDSSYTTLVTDCAYRKTAVPNGTHLNGVYVLDNRIAGTDSDCTAIPSRYYKIEFSSPSPSVKINWNGINSSVSPLVPEYNNTDIAVPYFILNGQNQSIDPNYVNGGNPSGISTSTIQAFCNTSYSTSTGLFSDFANAVTYGFCTVTSFLFVPNQNDLQNFYGLASTSQSKIPFSYFYQTYSILSGLTSSTTENLPTYALDLPAFGSTTALGVIIPTHIEWFSTTTISEYYPDSTRLTFLNLGSLAIWFSLIVVLYHRIVPKKDLV